MFNNGFIINFSKRSGTSTSGNGVQCVFPMSFTTTYFIIAKEIEPNATSANNTGSWSKIINMTNSYFYLVTGWTGTGSAKIQTYPANYIAIGW